MLLEHALEPWSILLEHVLGNALDHAPGAWSWAWQRALHHSVNLCERALHQLSRARTIIKGLLRGY